MNKQQLAEQIINDFETIDSFMSEAIDQGLDDDQIIEAVEDYFDQLDEQRQMGYVKSWKVSRYHNAGGMAVPAAISGAAGAALGHGFGIGAKTGAAIGVGATALAHLGKVRKDARMLRGKSGWVGPDKHQVYNKEFAKDQERKYDKFKQKPFHKRAAARIKTAVTGNPTHMESFHSDYRTLDQEIQEGIMRRLSRAWNAKNIRKGIVNKLETKADRHSLKASLHSTEANAHDAASRRHHKYSMEQGSIASKSAGKAKRVFNQYKRTEDPKKSFELSAKIKSIQTDGAAAKQLQRQAQYVRKHADQMFAISKGKEHHHQLVSDRNMTRALAVDSGKKLGFLAGKRKVNEMFGNSAKRTARLQDIVTDNAASAEMHHRFARSASERGEHDAAEAHRKKMLHFLRRAKTLTAKAGKTRYLTGSRSK